jgi:hypothetical protein
MPPTVKSQPRAAARRTVKARALALANPALHGPDVVEAQTLLTKSKYGNFHPGTIDGEYGAATAGATRDAKFVLGFPDAACDGVFGERIRAFLSGEPLPKDFVDRMQVRKHSQAKQLTLREKIVENALWGIANEPRIHYSNSRPIDGLHQAHKLPLNTDCSGFVTLCYAWAGAPDPNGRGYNGQGFTGDILQHGRRIPRSALQPGDLVVFGPGTGEHVVMVIQLAADPLVVSHGQEKGPLRTTLSVQVNAHHAPTTFLRAL